MLSVPLATLTGWNLRTAEIGAADEIYSMAGSTFLFPKTKAERERARDPRPSIEERYRGKQQYLDKYRAAVQELVRQGYLLDRDVAEVMRQGAAYWDWAMSSR
jgi:hypothetical protein